MEVIDLEEGVIEALGWTNGDCRESQTRNFLLFRCQCNACVEKLLHLSSRVNQKEEEEDQAQNNSEDG